MWCLSVRAASIVLSYKLTCSHRRHLIHDLAPSSNPAAASMSETTNKFGNSLTLPRDSIFHSVSKGTHSASHSGISGKGGRRHLIKAHLNRAFHHKSPTTGSQLTSSDVDEVSEPSFQSLEDFESISPGSRANNEEGGRLPRPRSLFSSLAGSIDDAPGAASTLISSSSSGNDEADAISASAKRHHRLHGLGKRKSLYASSLVGVEQLSYYLGNIMPLIP